MGQRKARRLTPGSAASPVLCRSMRPQCRHCYGPCCMTGMLRSARNARRRCTRADHRPRNHQPRRRCWRVPRGAGARACALRSSPDDTLVAIVMEKGPEQIVAALAVSCWQGARSCRSAPVSPDRRIAGILEQSPCARSAITQARIERRPGLAVEAVHPVRDAGGRTKVRPCHRCRRQTIRRPILWPTSSTRQATRGPPPRVSPSPTVRRSTRWPRSWSVCASASTSDDRVLWVSSFEFDLVHLRHIRCTWAQGGALVIPPVDRQQESGRLWVHLVRDHGVTLWELGRRWSSS